MSRFYKTELGFRTIKLRDLALNAKQRRLLLLIGSDDFNAMNPSMQNRIATPELIQQLLELGLIHTKGSLHTATDTPPTIQNTSTETPIPTSELPSQLHEPVIYNDQTCVITDTMPLRRSNSNDSNLVRMHASSLNELKEFMTQQLQQYCGLMAKRLIEKIHNTQHPNELKTCQMQWMTHLQESRIQPAQLNMALKYVNSSMYTLASN